MKKYVLCAALAAILATNAQAQSELDDLLKKQDAPPTATASPGVLTTKTPAANTTPPAAQGNNSAPADPGWTKYTNQRFGFALEFPAELVAGPTPADASGIEYHTADGKFSVAARAQYMGTVEEHDSLAKRFEDELKALGTAATYKRKAEGWYVVSGAKDGTEFYHKFFVQGRNWTEFQVTYPHKDSQKFDKWVEQIGKRFQPFLEGQFDRIKGK